MVLGRYLVRPPARAARHWNPRPFGGHGAIAAAAPAGGRGRCTSGAQWWLERQVVVHHASPVYRVHLTRDTLVTVSDDHACVWSRAGGTQLAQVAPRGVRLLASDSDGHRLAAACSDGTLRLWDLATGRERRVLEAMAPAHSLVLCGTILAAACGGDTLLADAFRGGRLCLWPGDPGAPAVPASDALGMAARAGTQVILWPSDPAAPAVTLAQRRAPVTRVALARGHVATAEADGSAHLWERFSGRHLGCLSEAQGEPVRSLGFHGHRLLVGREDECELVCCASQRRLGSLPAAVLAGRPLGHLWAATDTHGEAQLWRLARRGDDGISRPLARLGEAGAKNLALSTCGRGLAHASDDGRAAVWQLVRRPPSGAYPPLGDAAPPAAHGLWAGSTRAHHRGLLGPKMSTPLC